MEEQAIASLKRLIEKYDQQRESILMLKRAAETLLAVEVSLANYEDVGLSAAEAALAYLRETDNMPIGSDMLTKVLLDRGWRSEAKNKRSTISSALSRDRRFQRVPSGGYCLKKSF